MDPKQSRRQFLEQVKQGSMLAGLAAVGGIQVASKQSSGQSGSPQLDGHFNPPAEVATPPEAAILHPQPTGMIRNRSPALCVTQRDALLRSFTFNRHHPIHQRPKVMRRRTHCALVRNMRLKSTMRSLAIP